MGNSRVDTPDDPLNDLGITPEDFLVFSGADITGWSREYDVHPTMFVIAIRFAAGAAPFGRPPASVYRTTHQERECA